MHAWHLGLGCQNPAYRPNAHLKYQFEAYFSCMLARVSFWGLVYQQRCVSFDKLNCTVTSLVTVPRTLLTTTVTMDRKHSLSLCQQTAKQNQLNA
jgi:hypothetical protein